MIKKRQYTIWLYKLENINLVEEKLYLDFHIVTDQLSCRSRAHFNCQKAA